MSDERTFRTAVTMMSNGDYHGLRVLLIQYPNLVNWRDSSNATLLLKSFELTENNPNQAKLTRVLLVAGSNVNARRNHQSHVPLFSALRLKQLDVVKTLLEFGANLRASAHPSAGTVLDYAIELCREKNNDKVFTTKLSGLINAYTGGKLS